MGSRCSGCLPTEVEWEHAVLGMEHCLDQIFRKKFLGQIRRIKTRRFVEANRWGLSGMSGNIGDIWDAYDETHMPNAKAGTTKNPVKRETNRALSRGGCWGEPVDCYANTVFCRGVTGSSIFTKNKQGDTVYETFIKNLFDIP